MDDVDTRPAAVVDAGSAEAATVAANPSDPYLREAQTFPRLTAEQIGRAGSVKRVASAVGEGSVVVSSVHQMLAEH